MPLGDLSGTFANVRTQSLHPLLRVSREGGENAHTGDSSFCQVKKHAEFDGVV